MRRMYSENQVKRIAKEVIVVPEAPTEEGTYVLKVIVNAEGKPQYQWVKEA